MPLPPRIEIVPPTEPAHAEITVPGSKSITNRALVLAALGNGETILQGALWSEDTQVMVECLQAVGFKISVGPDPREPCNRVITVGGQGGRIPPGGSVSKPLELFVANAGTVARFLAAMLCLGSGTYRLHGVSRMHERPQEALFAALRELGYCIDSVNSRLPAVIHGGGPKPATCCVSLEQSSQFASALLLSAARGGWHVNVVGANAEESPYVEMTRRLCQVFPERGGVFQIEPDASSGSYFWGAGCLELGEREPAPDASTGPETRLDFRLTVTVRDWPRSGWQIDARFPERMLELATRCPAFCAPLFQDILNHYGKDWQYLKNWLHLRDAEWMARQNWAPLSLSRQSDLGDSILTAIVLAPLAVSPVKFTDLGRLRLQECERVKAVRTELSRCGASVRETGDTLEVVPSTLHGAEIETYNDHRLAMCFAILGLKVPGIKIKNPACVKKTFPNFFQKLAVPRPAGVGATILDAATDRRLELNELFAG